MIQQHLGEGAAGAIVEGDGNEVTVKNITINKARRKLKVSATLAYSLDRVPQLQEIKPCEEVNDNPRPHLYIAEGDYQDAAETLAKRASEQQIIADDCRVVDPDFRHCQSSEEFIETWSKSLYNTLCAATPNPNANSMDAYWQAILETLESSGEQCVIINCSVVDDEILSTSAKIWLQWLDTVHQRLMTLSKPNRIRVFLSFTPQSTLLTSPLTHWNFKKVIKRLSSISEIDVKRLPSFDPIIRNHCLDWCDDLFLQWITSNRDHLDNQNPEELRSDIKTHIDKLFADTQSVPLRKVGETLRDSIRQSLNT
tara:strand:- start:166 stop:1098 length:933 start_codon:yes stop_codon:yes gene_type:complete